MELAFVCMGKKSVSAESAEYFPNVEFVLGNIIGIDEDSSKYMMTMTSIISAKMSFIKCWKAAGALVSTSGINHSKDP